MKINQIIVLKTRFVSVLMILALLSPGSVMLGSTMQSAYATVEEEAEEPEGFELGFEEESREIEEFEDTQFEEITPADEEELAEETLDVEGVLEAEPPGEEEIAETKEALEDLEGGDSMDQLEDNLLSDGEELEDNLQIGGLGLSSNNIESILQEKIQSEFELDLGSLDEENTTPVETNNGALELEELEVETNNGALELEELEEELENVPGAGVSFDGPTKAMCQGFGPTGVLQPFVPSDSTIAAGQNHIVVMNNACIAIFDINGQLVIPPSSLGAFFGAGNNFLADPFITVDVESGRFFATVMDVTAGGTHLGISSVFGPLDPWQRTFIPFRVQGNTEFFDQQFHATSGDKFVVSGNMFSDIGPDSVFLGGQIAVIDKDCLLAGVEICTVFYTPRDLNVFQTRPVRTSNTHEEINLVTSTVGTIDSPGTTIRLETIAGPAIPNALTRQVFFVPVRNYIVPPSGDQPGTITPLDTDATRIGSAYETPDNRFIWITLNNACSVPDGSNSCVRLIQIDKSTLLAVQDFDFKDPNYDIAYGALTVDRQGTLYVVFLATSEQLGVFPSVYAGRQLPGAAAQTLDGILPLANGQTFAAEVRWGDYSGAEPDPDGEGAYLHGMYQLTPDNWGTAIGIVT